MTGAHPRVSTMLLVVAALVATTPVASAPAFAISQGQPQADKKMNKREPKEPASMTANDRAERRPPAYRVEGSGPLLVYIAGLDGTGEVFFKQGPALARSYRIVTFRSRDDKRFTYEDLADDVAAIINDLGEPRATIVAESFGGGVAFTFALRHAAMVERLVIVSSFARFHSPVKIRMAVMFGTVMPFWLTSPARMVANGLG